MTLTHNHAQLTATVAEHIAVDAVIQGEGCFIGCLTHGNNPTAIETAYGIPVMLTRLAESIFEGLPADEAREFFAAFPAAVGRDGKDLSCVSWRFLAQILRELPPQSPAAQTATDTVIAGLDLLANGQPWPDAAAATRAVNAAAAWAAAAAAAAARAAPAADAAADAAARAAARAAAATRRRQRDLLLTLIREAQ